MNTAKDDSSLPLLLTIAGAVAAVGIGGWFFLGYESGGADATQDSQDLSAFVRPSSAAVEPSARSTDVDVAADYAGKTDAIDVSEISVALTKARLAADADILLVPAKQSAFYYYGQVLDAEPGHALATAELDAVLARLEQEVTTHLAKKEYDDAYRIASIVATRQPEHSLVSSRRSRPHRTAMTVAPANSLPPRRHFRDATRSISPR